MAKDNRNGSTNEAAQVGESTSLETIIRQRARDLIDAIVEARGPTTFKMPRARVISPAGTSSEWRSALVPRYHRRSERVDAAILGVYLSGTNTRRIKGALAPLPAWGAVVEGRRVAVARPARWGFRDVALSRSRG